jgi:hypothetical protein
MRNVRIVGLVAGLVLLLGLNASAAPILVSTGDLGDNVVDNAGDYLWQPVLTLPTGAGPDELEIKYGLWNSPAVPVDVFVNGTLAGSFDADQGFTLPGPEFVTFDVTGLLVNGLNSILFTGNNVNSGDYVIGQVDLTYDAAAVVPEPVTLTLFSVGVAGVAWRRRAQRR